MPKTQSPELPLCPICQKPLDMASDNTPAFKLNGEPVCGKCFAERGIRPKVHNAPPPKRPTRDAPYETTEGRLYYEKYRENAT